MATFNLIRNSRVFFTTNVDGNGLVGSTSFTSGNTQEMQVLDGFTFSQASNADTVTISEAGGDPVRGQRSFNTSLGNVEFSFSTYIRPKKPSTVVTAEEANLWNALLCSTAVGTAGVAAGTSISDLDITSAGVMTLTATTTPNLVAGEVYVVHGATGDKAHLLNTAIKVTSNSGTVLVAQYLTSPGALLNIQTQFSAATYTKTAWNANVAISADTGFTSAYSSATTALSNKNQLLPFGMMIAVDSVTYVIDNCALDQAVVDFGLDGIATVAWTGKGTALRQLATTITGASGTFATGVAGSYAEKVTDANFITNKLSTVTLHSAFGGAGTAYTLALTGGSITIANNITYVTPANLGVVNLPIGYFTGTRAISGSMTAYLRTGSTNTAGLLSQLLADSDTTTEPKYSMTIAIGGAANATHVDVIADSCFLQIPTIDAQAVMSTTINFTVQAADPTLGTPVYDIENTNELMLRYFSL